MKKIGWSTISNCMVDITQLKRLCRDNSEVNAFLINMLNDILVTDPDNMPTGLQHSFQLRFNTLMRNGILVFLDETQEPCETAAELFDTSTMFREDPAEIDFDDLPF